MMLRPDEACRNGVYMLYIEPMCPLRSKSSITIVLLNIPLNNGFILEFGLVTCQLEKVEGGIKVTTDKGEVFEADAVMFATGNSLHFVCHMFHIQYCCCFGVEVSRTISYMLK